MRLRSVAMVTLAFTAGALVWWAQPEDAPAPPRIVRMPAPVAPAGSAPVAVADDGSDGVEAAAGPAGPDVDAAQRAMDAAWRDALAVDLAGLRDDCGLVVTDVHCRGAVCAVVGPEDPVAFLGQIAWNRPMTLVEVLAIDQLDMPKDWSPCGRASDRVSGPRADYRHRKGRCHAYGRQGEERFREEARALCRELVVSR